MSTACKQYINESFSGDPQLVEQGAFNIIGWTLINKSATDSDVTVRIYDAASTADVEVGTTSANKTLLVPPGPGINLQTNEMQIQLACSKGIVVYACRGISTGDEVSLSSGVYIELLYLPNQ